MFHKNGPTMAQHVHKFVPIFLGGMDKLCLKVVKDDRETLYRCIERSLKKACCAQKRFVNENTEAPKTTRHNIRSRKKNVPNRYAHNLRPYVNLSRI